MALGKWHSPFGTSKDRGHGQLSRRVKLENAEGRENLQASLVYGAPGEEKSKHPPSESEDGAPKIVYGITPGPPTFATTDATGARRIANISQPQCSTPI